MRIFFFAVISVYFFSCNSISGEKKYSWDRSLSDSGWLVKAEFSRYTVPLNSFFSETLLNNFNGSILVAKDDTIVYEKYQGKVDLRKEDNITENTPFHIASVSKPITAMAILELVQEKKLSLDDSLTNFFPCIPYSGITIRMLLNHRSGLPNYLYFISESDWDKNVYVTNKDVIEQICLLKPTQTFPTDKHFSYSNTNYALLALVVEQITGKPFPEYMKEKFFAPLGMKDTYIFTLADSLKATPSFYTNGNFWQHDFLDGTYGDKNVYTTPRDLFKWERALMSGRIINRSLLDSAFKPYSQENRSIHNYGLGWRMAIFPEGKKIIYHFGRWHGFNAALAYLPNENVVIIITGNRFTYSVYNAAHRFCNIFGEYWQKQTEMEDTDSMETYSESTKTSTKASQPQTESK